MAPRLSAELADADLIRANERVECVQIPRIRIVPDRDELFDVGWRPCVRRIVDADTRAAVIEIEKDVQVLRTHSHVVPATLVEGMGEVVSNREDLLPQDLRPVGVAVAEAIAVEVNPRRTVGHAGERSLRMA